MVLSKLNAAVKYPESRKIYRDDIKKEVDLYEVEIERVDIIIALGNMRNQYEEENILYYPIYLVKHNNKVIQIGLYEIEASNYQYYLDTYDNVDIDKLRDPIIYSFVTKEMLERLRMKPEEKREPNKYEGSRGDDSDDKDSDDEKDNDANVGSLEYKIPSGRSDIFILTSGFHVPELLQEETKAESKNIIEKYKQSKDDDWIQKFMKNKYYSLTDNEGGGDCFFSTIRDAFSNIGQQTTVSKLREKLSADATEEIFTRYKEYYDLFYMSIVTDSAKIKEYFKEYQDIKKELSNIFDREKKHQLLIKAKEIKSKHDTLVEEKKITTQNMNDYTFMKGIDTLEKFKKKIKTCDFWAETWAISTMERVLNVKFIVMSSQLYKAGDLENVLQCSEMNDAILQESQTFNPEFYIIVDYTGNHYKLIGYKNKQIFKFSEIPYGMKKMVVKRCLEKNAGTFSLISDFTKFKDMITKKHVARGQDDDAIEDLEEFTESKLRGLYDEDVVFVYYNQSASSPLPGKGSKEKLPKEYVKEFAGLAMIHDWRRKLSFFWIAPFTLDNHTWATVEHYYNACKFKKESPEFYLNFAIDSKTEMSGNPEMARGAGGKTGEFGGTVIRPSTVHVDSDYSKERENKNIFDAQYAKFTQNPEMMKLLIETKNAKLMKSKSGKEPHLDNVLILVRDKIMKKYVF